MQDIMDGTSGIGILLPIVIVIVALVLIGITVASRYKIASPDEAILITGSGATKKSGEEDLPAAQKIVQGGGVFVVPFIQQAHVISLRSRQIEINVNAISKNGIRLRLEGVSIVKVGGDDKSVRAAAQRFLGQQDEINRFTSEVLSGSLRSIVGNLTVEDIISDRQALASRVSDEAENSLTGQGLELDTFQIQEINDDGEYLDNLGRPEEAAIEQKAAISEAESRRESERARIAADQEILNSQRELDLRQAEIQRETDAAKAEASASGPRAKARAQQEVLDEEQKVAERQAKLREQELIAEVNKKADSERYREEQEAEARSHAEITKARASAERVKLEAEADANRVKLSANASAEEVRLAGQAESDHRRSIAEAVEAEGRAEAAATREKAFAEAEGMDKKAEAYKNYGQAAIIDRFVEVLPAVIKAGSDPISNIDKMTVIDSRGASKLTETGANNVAQGLETFSSVLGIDLKAMLGGMTEGFGSGSDFVKGETVADETEEVK